MARRSHTSRLFRRQAQKTVKASPKINPRVLLAVLGVGVAVAAGQVGWNHFAAAQEELLRLDQEQAQPGIAAVLADPEGLRQIQANSKKISDLNKEMEGKLEKFTGGWKEASEKAAAANQPWSKDAGAWKDELIRSCSEILERSRNTPKAKRVELPEDFYLGLDAFRQKNPEAAEVPGLTRELQVARHLVDLLRAAREASSEAYSTPCRLKKMEGPTVLRDKKTPDSSRPATGGSLPLSPPSPMIFRLALECSPEVLYEFIARLTRDTWLLLPRNIEVINPIRQFPSRSEKMKSFQTEKTSDRPGDPTNSPSKLIEVLAGKEALEVLLELEYLDWNSPVGFSEAKKAGGKP